MAAPLDDDDPIPRAVEAAVAAIEATAAARPVEDAERFTLDVLLNAMLGVLEVIRARDPAAHQAHLRSILAVLRDD